MTGGRSLIIELHGWRGIKRDGGPLGQATTLGFITILWCPFLLSEWVRIRADALRNVLRS